MDNEKKQRLEEVLQHFENNIVEKVSKLLRETETNTQHQSAKAYEKLERIEQLIHELGQSENL